MGLEVRVNRRISRRIEVGRGTNVEVVVPPMQVERCIDLV